mmetsp:Transcript_1042/g.1989  ORF Transcript_1042/g.1989 Transcript_1042/m.1989 type:complete len:109 (-) Transcript_1042:485-811(-)
MRSDCPQRVALGGVLGASVGASFGTMIGLWECLKAWPGTRQALFIITRYAGASALGFGVFMGVGSFIRQCEELSSDAATHKIWTPPSQAAQLRLQYARLLSSISQPKV